MYNTYNCEAFYVPKYTREAVGGKFSVLPGIRKELPVIIIPRCIVRFYPEPAAFRHR